MRGFIEVTNEKSNKKILINVQYIKSVFNNIIFIGDNYPDFVMPDYIKCVETYEVIKEMIEEAHKRN